MIRWLAITRDMLDDASECQLTEDETTPVVAVTPSFPAALVPEITSPPVLLRHVKVLFNLKNYLYKSEEQDIMYS